jgi:hypothetical protein
VIWQYKSFRSEQVFSSGITKFFCHHIIKIHPPIPIRNVISRF